MPRAGRTKRSGRAARRRDWERLKSKSLHGASPSARRARDFLLGQPLGVARLMEARRDLAVRDDGPRLTDDDWLAAMQAGFRRPVDETIRDPVIDAPALVLKDCDDLGLGAPDQIDEVGRRIVGP